MGSPAGADPSRPIDINPLTRLAKVALAWFSPDCKHFSKAKGGKPVEKSIRDLAWVVVEWARDVLERRDRTQGGVTAPADGLYLLAVRYPERFDLPANAGSAPGFIERFEEVDPCERPCSPA